GPGRPLPRGPLLSPERRPPADPAAARAHRGHPAARRALHPPGRVAARRLGARRVGRGARGPARLLLARQRARAAQRHPARARAQPRRGAAPSRAPRGTPGSALEPGDVGRAARGTGARVEDPPRPPRARRVGRQPARGGGGARPPPPEPDAHAARPRAPGTDRPSALLVTRPLGPAGTAPG